MTKIQATTIPLNTRSRRGQRPEQTLAYRPEESDILIYFSAKNALLLP